MLLDVQNNGESIILFLNDMIDLILIINVYMPCDTVREASCSEYEEVLHVISSIIHKHDAQFVIIGGDFNYDFSRKSALSTVINAFMSVEHIVRPNNSKLSNIDYSYVNHHAGTCSIIDHFLVTPNLVECIKTLFVEHQGDNLSDHDPIFMELVVQHEKVSRNSTNKSYKCIDWNLVTDAERNNYVETLDMLLDDINLPCDTLSCKDLYCCEHNNDIDKYGSDIMNACLQAGELCIPHRMVKTGSSHQSKSIPGWKEYVAPVREQSIFWHNLWIECGRPKHGHIADTMRMTRAKYHYTIRWVRQNETNFKNSKFAQSLINNNTKDYWKEVKKHRGTHKASPTSIDGASSDKDIANIFARKYDDLFNCVSYENCDMENLKCKIDKKIDESTCAENYLSCTITVEDVVNNSKCLNKEKSDGKDMFSDHIINGGHKLFTHLSLLLSVMLRHGSCPDDLIKSYLIPIPKDCKKSLCNSDNYRAIEL